MLTHIYSDTVLLQSMYHVMQSIALHYRNNCDAELIGGDIFFATFTLSVAHLWPLRIHDITYFLAFHCAIGGPLIVIINKELTRSALRQFLCFV